MSFDIPELTLKENPFGELGIEYGPGWPDRFGTYLQSWSSSAILEPIRTLSLFTGAGGLDIGFHDAGFNIKAIVEIEEFFIETLRVNCGLDRLFGDLDIFNIDIREFRTESVPKIDFVIGGPPCQTFSAAGRRAAGVQGTCDDRGTLFEEYVRILRELKPHAFLFENVYGITGAEGGAAWERIIRSFKEAGYNVFHRILDAADYGVPQHRERLFIVGVETGTYKFPRPTHGPDSLTGTPFYTAGEAVAGVPLSHEEKALRVGGRFGELLDEIPPGLNYSFFTENMGHPQPIFAWRSKFSDFLYKADPEVPARAIKAQGGQYTGPFHWQNRPFSVAEFKRLQTIPDDYEILGGKQKAVMQIGNSVPPQLGRVLALGILDQLFHISLPFDLSYLDERETLGFRKRKRLLTGVYRQKAKEALDSVVAEPEADKCTKVDGQAYYASLGKDFELNVEAKRSDSVHVEFEPGDSEWVISVAKGRRLRIPILSITIKPSVRGNWIVPAEQVVLVGNRLQEDIFTMLWKAFEAELVRLNIKADLVQLSGYYQYRPAFACAMSLRENGDNKWHALRTVVEGECVREILPAHFYCELWNISEEDILEYMTFLRGLGYEARNHRTNPQIPEGYYLIPYAFPTLTKMSVQLRKSLGG